MKAPARALVLLACLSSGVTAVLSGSALAAPADGQLQPSQAGSVTGPLTDVPPGGPAPSSRPASPPSPVRPADPATYARQKADANARAAQGSSTPEALTPAAPVLSRNWQGIEDASSAPSDSTGAIGTQRFIELVNSRYAIYSRTSDVPINTGTANLLVASTAGNVFDPQIIWDPGTKRFYYAWDDVESATDHRLVFGFSKTATPNTGGTADWCKYSFAYGSEFPDFPKLGDTKDFLLIGANVFDGATDAFIRSDVAWVTKPPAGVTCPSATTLLAGTKAGLRNADATTAFTPVPANQTDTSSKGWVVARPASLPATYLSVYKVTKNATTGAATFGAARRLTVPSYTVPANAAQPGTTQLIDTSDGRLTQAVSAIDPARGAGGSDAIWTQHTVLGGAGAEVRWYEIDPATTTLFQSGVSSGSGGLFEFNGSISPDRKVSGSTKLFGSNMVLGLNTSSTTQSVDFRTRSKIGGGPVSATVGVVISTGSMTGCGGVCRWGDYAAASPDPAAASTGATGQVWLTSQLAHGGTQFDWATWNTAVTP